MENKTAIGDYDGLEGEKTQGGNASSEVSIGPHRQAAEAGDGQGLWAERPAETLWGKDGQRNRYKGPS